MAQDLEKLVVQLSADMRKYENAMARAQAVTNQRAKAIEGRLAGMNKRLLGQFNSLGPGLGKALATVGGAKLFQELSDSATKIRNALKVAGQSGDGLERTFDKLYDSAQRNSVPIEAMAQLYSRVSLAQGELGVSSDEIIGLIDDVGKSLRISGVDAQTASGGLLQLAQALGSSKIQAEEYGSLIDSMPGVLQAAANGIEQAGGSVSKLTQLVKSGQISNKAFFDGINAGRSVLDQRLAGSVQTVEQRFITLRNALVKTADRFNTNTKAADALGGEFDQLVGYISALDFTGLITDLQTVIGVLETGAGKAQAFAVALGKLSGMANIGDSIIGAIDPDGDGKVSALGGLLTAESTLSNGTKLQENAERRLSVEKQIKALQDAPPSEEVSRSIAKLQAQLSQIPATKKQPGITQPAYALPGGSPLPPKPKVDITADRYRTDDDKPGGRGGRGSAGKRSADDFAREIEQIKNRTVALNEETRAQEALCGVIFTL